MSVVTHHLLRPFLGFQHQPPNDGSFDNPKYELKLQTIIECYYIMLYTLGSKHPDTGRIDVHIFIIGSTSLHFLQFCNLRPVPLDGFQCLWLEALSEYI